MLSESEEFEKYGISRVNQVQHVHQHSGSVLDMSTKLGGAILKKAELENRFSDFYLQIFEKIAEIELLGAEDILEVFGDMGG